MKLIEKKHIALFFSICLATVLSAQLHGNNWVIGPAYISLLDFRSSPPIQSFLEDTLSMFETTASISNAAGEFQFFTNGIYVANRFGERMPHGDSLSFYNYHNYYDIVYQNGMPQSQGALILPMPNDSTKYILFHYSPVDTFFVSANRSYNVPRNFYYSIVDMTADGGKGDVVKKNVRLPWNGLGCASRMTATKHANGRDWWVIRHGFKDSTYVKFLLTPDTIVGPYFQKIGPPFNNNQVAVDYYGTSVFNLEGTRFATGNLYGPLVVLDFDRCTGEFSSPLVLYNKLADTTLLGVAAVAFSPNGRFLYVNNIYELNQYDLTLTNPNDSVRLYTADSSDGYYLNQMRLGPDNKIYIGTWHGGSGTLHVIAEPDLPGNACQFQRSGLQCLYSANTWSLPNSVNYQLQSIHGSTCDTLTSMIDFSYSPKISVSFYPNPANDYFIIQSNSYFDSPIQLAVYDLLGNNVHSSVVMLENGVCKISCMGMQNGLYIVKLYSKHSTLLNGKINIIH